MSLWRYYRKRVLAGEEYRTLIQSGFIHTHFSIHNISLPQPQILTYIPSLFMNILAKLDQQTNPLYQLNHCSVHLSSILTPICASKVSINGSDNGLSLSRCQSIIWTNAGILLIRTLGRHLSEILIYVSLSKKMHTKMSAKWRPFCFGLSVLKWSKYIFCTPHT